MMGGGVCFSPQIEIMKVSTGAADHTWKYPIENYFNEIFYLLFRLLFPSSRDKCTRCHVLQCFPLILSDNMEILR